MALSIVPCSDEATHVGADADNIECLSKNHSHDHSDHTEDDCTPFCTCICCGSVMSMPTTYHLDDPQLAIIKTKLLPYNFNYSFSYNLGVWHPPTNC